MSNRTVRLNHVESKWRYGCLWPFGHPFRDYQQDLADRINNVTSGRLTVVLSEPLAEAEIVARLLRGQLEMASTSAFQDIVPEAGLSYLPYTYTDVDHFVRVWDLERSPVAAKISQLILSRTRLLVMGWSIVGRRDLLTRTRPVKAPADLHELRIRVDAPTTRSTFEALGAKTLDLPYPDVLGHFAQGLIDGAENSVSNILLMKWHERASWLSLTAHTFLANIEVVRSDAWAALDPSERNALNDSFRALLDQCKKGESLRRQDALEELRKSNVNILPAADLALGEFTRLTEPVRCAFVQNHRLHSSWEYILDSNL